MLDLFIHLYSIFCCFFKGAVPEKVFQKAEVKKVVETRPEQSKQHFVVPFTKPASTFAIFEDVVAEPASDPPCQAVGAKVEDDIFRESMESEYAKLSHEVEKHEPMTTFSGKCNVTTNSKFICCCAKALKPLIVSMV